MIIGALGSVMYVTVTYKFVKMVQRDIRKARNPVISIPFRSFMGSEVQ